MTPKQNELYQYLLARIDDPVCPTLEEMAAALGLKAKSGAHRLLEALEAMGRVRRGGAGTARQIRAVPVDPFYGVSSAAMIAELKRRGEWPHGR